MSTATPESGVCSIFMRGPSRSSATRAALQKRDRAAIATMRGRDKRTPGDTPGSVQSSAARRRSHVPLDHHLLDLCNRLGGVEALGAGLGAVHDRVTAIELERIFQIVQPLARRLVAAVDDPAIGVQ